MEEALRKIIKKVILPKYPWIKDFEVIDKKAGSMNFYYVYYYVDYNLYDGKSGELGNEHVDVRYKTKTLFDILGPPTSDLYNGTTFRDYGTTSKDYKIIK